MATYAPPRCSGVLRLALSKDGKAVDLITESQKRERQLREAHKAVALSRVTGEGRLTWANFTQGVEDLDENQTRKMRATFNVFMAEIKDLLGDENLSSEELQEMASVVYELFDDDSKPTQQKSAMLTKLLRQSPPKKSIDSVQESVSTLSVWKATASSPLDIGHDLSVTKEQQTKEYGSHLLFSFEAPDFWAQAPEPKPQSRAAEFVKLKSPSTAAASQASSAFASKAELVLPKGNWLEVECRKFSSSNPGDVYKSLIAVAKSAQSVEALQVQLFDLLGAEGLDLMGLVVERWAEVKKLSFKKFEKQEHGPSKSAYAPMQGGMSVSVEIEKLSQKERKRLTKAVAPTANHGAISGAAERAQLENYARIIEEGDRSALPIVMRDDFRETGSALLSQEAKFHMPVGAKRVDLPEYESMWLPPKYPPKRNDNSLVPITEFEPWARGAFKGYKSLNRIQSMVFNSAYYSNENLLICAPTGAGKTNIAMLTILREIGLNMVDGVLQKDNFKVCYVAPMKALAAEMTAGFGKRLAYLGIQVRELTGDMQLTKTEIEETQMIITTPEKWDVITRKSTDSPLTQIVHLLILDEVHLLNEGRGPVIETIVARTLRQVEATQSMIRIVGLSATLPNYKDVAQFMRVNESSGLHYFDGSYRPVPLEQTFVGVKAKGFQQQRVVMTNFCYDTIVQTLRKGKQVMIFVHSRKDTSKTAQDLLALAEEKGESALFDDAVANGKNSEWARKEISKSRNQDVKRLFLAGFGCHHAGMLRSDRNMVEKMFSEGLIKVLCCTATLAWGVNLPAKQVIIKGTKVYNAEKGGFVSLGMLDVMQIFGRAGRPQFDDEGSAIMVTTHDELYRYLQLTATQAPIESQLIKGLVDNLNAEIVLGTVTNIQEAVAWLSYTYLFVRMLKNPMVYGISYEERQMDPNLVNKRTELIVAAATELDNVRMIRFNNPYFSSTSMGQTASHYYIHHESIETFNNAFEKKANTMTLESIIQLVSSASEFDHMMSREEELSELDKLKRSACPVTVKGDPAGDRTVKVNILMQAYISRAPITAFALICDMNFVAQNAARITRGLFEIALRRGLPDAASLLLKLCKMIDLRIWDSMHPLRQFPHLIKDSLVIKLEDRGLTVEKLLEMEPSEISAITRVPAATKQILSAIESIPYIEVETSVQPITRSIIRIRVTLTPKFRWNDRLHGAMQPFWIWVENPEEVGILHHEYFLLRKKENHQSSEIVFTTPVAHPVPAQYILHVCSDRWLGSDNYAPLSFKHLILPDLYPPHTKLLDLQPLPITALHNPVFESLFKYPYFNPIQTQIFHTIYHTDQNVLLGAPTGSGKTVAAELAVLRLMKETPHLKAVYLGPLKALVQERLKDWGNKFVTKLGKKMVELTGEFTPDVLALRQADIICTTPEKWDGVSRSWQNRGYVKQVGLIIIDEIHLLGEDRGPILEVIVSRMRHISSKTDTPVRVIGLSTALANAKDLAEWLGITGPGLFNFHPSVRPVPLKIHVQGYEGKNYCPRMSKMNRPCYQAILSYSPQKPVLIFVSSRRQTRLTAVDIISHVAGDGAPRRFISSRAGCEDQLKTALLKIRDPNLRHCLSFGIGLHHAGLPRDDRAIVEDLFGDTIIQVLVSTSTLAWGVNLPAHLVIVKGGEYFDAKTHRYVDYAITDMLQMMGRAGRPQFDDSGEAVIMVTAAMKGFYKKFLYEPFPVESSLADVLHSHLNAEIVSGTITTRHEAVDYLTWTYLFRRILMNPTYYGLESSSLESVNKFMSSLIDDCLQDLEASHCVELDEDGTTIWALTMGKIISYYYLSHETARLFFDEIDEDCDEARLLQILCSAKEYDELPVRHNEDGLNEELSKDEGVRWELHSSDWESPSVKANLLLQSHMSRVLLPISDYITDQKSVLDQAIRILQAMVDVAADGGWLFACLRCMHLTQSIVQAQWLDQSSFNQLPFFDSPKQHKIMADEGFHCLPQLLAKSPAQQERALKRVFKDRKDRIKSCLSVLKRLPLVEMQVIVDKNKIVKAGEELVLEIKVRKTSGSPSAQAYCPMFGKQKREGYWLLIGDSEEGELLALKRITISKVGRWQTVKLEIENPEEDDESDGSVDHRTFWAYLMHDSYLGLDIQTKFNVGFE